MSNEAGEVRTEALDAEAQARRRLALTQIRQYPDSVLRMQARDVESFDDELRSLVARMTALMTDAHGIGLAATQIGILRRVFVFVPDEDGPVALINPSVAERSEERLTDDEGCLSLQGVLVPVERNVRVTIVGLDPKGEEIRLELADIAARVAQHELDHLDGVLMLDRTDPESRRSALAVLRPRPVLELR